VSNQDTSVSKKVTSVSKKNTHVTFADTLPDEMRMIVRRAAQPVMPGDQIGAQINRAARRLDLPHRRTQEFWYGRARRILAQEADRMRAWHRAWIEAQRARLAADMASLDAEEARLKRVLQRLENEDGG